jgi:hypothetical protein
LIHLAFRFDDPSRSSDHALERGILERFGAASIPLTAAVVPFDCSSPSPRALTARAVPHLVEAHREGILEVALHGYCHRCLARLLDGNSTELAGIGEQRQRTFLQDGKTCLEGIFGSPMRGFVPPWNSYDQVTLGVLAALGFRYLSADWALVGDDAPALTIVPHTCNLMHLREAVTEARRFGNLDARIIVILHHFDFVESGSEGAGTDLRRLGRLLAWAGAQPDLACSSLGSLADGLEPGQSRRNLRLAQWRSGLHWRLQRLFPRYTLVGGGPAGFTYGIARGAFFALPGVLGV